MAPPTSPASEEIDLRNLPNPILPLHPLEPNLHLPPRPFLSALQRRHLRLARPAHAHAPKIRRMKSHRPLGHIDRNRHLSPASALHPHNLPIQRHPLRRWQLPPSRSRPRRCRPGSCFTWRGRVGRALISAIRRRFRPRPTLTILGALLLPLFLFL